MDLQNTFAGTDGGCLRVTGAALCRGALRVPHGQRAGLLKA